MMRQPQHARRIILNSAPGRSVVAGAGAGNGCCSGHPLCHTRTVVDHIRKRSVANPASHTQEHNLKRQIGDSTSFVTCSLKRLPMMKKFRQPRHRRRIQKTKGRAPNGYRF
jgi:hypothetical protein